MAESTRSAKKRKTYEEWDALMKETKSNKAADERKTKQTPQSKQHALESSIKDLDKAAEALQRKPEPSMAPYAASELAHFSNERLVKYIIDLQEQLGKVKSESAIKGEEKPTCTPLISTETNLGEKTSGHLFFDDAKFAKDFAKEEIFDLEIMQTRAALIKNVLEHSDKVDGGSPSSAFTIEVNSKRVIEELFGLLDDWIDGPGGEKGKIIFLYQLDVSYKGRFRI